MNEKTALLQILKSIILYWGTLLKTLSSLFMDAVQLSYGYKTITKRHSTS